MVKAFNRLTQNLAAKEQQITRMFQEQRLQDEQALAQMNHRLKVSLEAAAIAHEINQPLSILRLTAQRLQHQLRERADAGRSHRTAGRICRSLTIKPAGSHGPPTR